MAQLETIRQKGPLVALVIGIALLAFILGDLVRSGKFIFNKSELVVAEIAGNSVEYPDFQRKIEEVSEIYRSRSGGSLDQQTAERIRMQVWEQVVRENVLESEYDELGVDVSSGELSDMVLGKNIDPTVKQLFSNPETGEFNRGLVNQFLTNLKKANPNDPNKSYWLYIESEIKKNRQYQKYVNLISKGLYVTKNEAEDEYVSKNKKANIKYVMKPLSSVPANTIKVTDNEISEYYETHKDDYKQNESRDIEYVTFEVKPSAEDKEDARKWIEDIAKDFKETDDVEQFIRLNDPDHPMDRKHYTKDELPTNVSVAMFNAEAGEVYGPYLENGTYKLAKLVETIEFPDTVKARHILIQPDARTKEAYDVAKAKADSLKTLITEGADFAELAKEHSTDKGSAVKGGDLGWFKEGSMVRQFNDTCFYGNPGDIKIAETQYGFHIIEILEQGVKSPKVQVAFLNKPIEASKQTIDNVYQEASKFIGINNTPQKFDQAIQDKGINKKIAKNLTPMAKQIAGLGESRDIVRAAYLTDKGQIIKDSQGNPVFEFEGKFVVGKLVTIREEGIQPLDVVKEVVRTQVVKEKQIAQLEKELNEKLQGKTSIDGLASDMGVEVKEASDISFSSYQIRGAGFEPKVIGAVSNLEPNKLSKPIAGNNGVFIVEVADVTDANIPENIDGEKRTLLRSVRTRAYAQAYSALKDAANVVDNRARFY